MSGCIEELAGTVCTQGPEGNMGHHGVFGGSKGAGVLGLIGGARGC